MNKVVNEPGTHGDLKAFDGINQKGAQATIEVVASPDDVEVCAGFETVGWFVVSVANAERMKITGQAVVIYHSEASDKSLSAGDQASCNKLIGLLFEREWSFVIDHQATSGFLPPNPGKKKTHRITHFSINADRGAAGLIGETSMEWIGLASKLFR